MKDRKLKPYLLGLSLISLLIEPLSAQNVDKGYRVGSSMVSSNVQLLSIPATNEAISLHIKKVNPKLKSELREEIANQIILVANCFLIDPWLLASLVQKESSYIRDAVSITGASGLTQFTNIGFKEVHDQLGMRGKLGATEGSIQYFNETLSTCVDQNWVHLWNKINLPEEDINFYVEAKEEIKQDTLLSLSYGAILLKTYMAVISIRANASDEVLTMAERYYYALQMYNGEEGDAKIRYARAIFKQLNLFYPNKDELIFNFLETDKDPDILLRLFPN